MPSYHGVAASSVPNLVLWMPQAPPSPSPSVKMSVASEILATLPGKICSGSDVKGQAEESAYVEINVRV